MSTTATTLLLADADAIAAAFIKRIAPVCHRVECAGSVRRRRPHVGDLEFVCISQEGAALFGVPTLESTIDELCERKPEIIRELNGPRQKRLIKPGKWTIELFIVPPEEWGVALVIRTGNAEFSKAFVTERSRGGLLPDGWCVRNNRLWRKCQREDVEVVPGSWADPVDTRDEGQVFEAIGLGWITPADRRWPIG